LHKFDSAFRAEHCAEVQTKNDQSWTLITYDKDCQSYKDNGQMTHSAVNLDLGATETCLKVTYSDTFSAVL